MGGDVPKSEAAFGAHPGPIYGSTRATHPDFTISPVPIPLRVGMPKSHRGGLRACSSRQGRELPRRIDAPERVRGHFFRMLPEHVDPSACKFRGDS